MTERGRSAWPARTSRSPCRRRGSCRTRTSGRRRTACPRSRRRPRDDWTRIEIVIAKWASQAGWDWRTMTQVTVAYWTDRSAFGGALFEVAPEPEVHVVGGRRVAVALGELRVAEGGQFGLGSRDELVDVQQPRTLDLLVERITRAREVCVDVHDDVEVRQVERAGAPARDQVE